jgi:hypothetical protein
MKLLIQPLVATLLSSLLLAGTAAASWDVAANVDVQSRLFTDSARWPGQDSGTAQLSLAGTLELRWQDRETGQRASIIPYLRLDATDDERSIADLREAYWAFHGESVEVLVGANTVFWGVTESVHLVDIVNQADAVADIDGEDKLGQPMVNITLQQDWGLFSAFVMPWFRERTFAGVDGRLRTPLPVDTDAARYESSAEEQHVDVALRYSHYFGDFDVGLSLFSGTSREPRLLPNAAGTALVPWYDQIDQFGVDLQYTRDAWLWKFEGIVRDGYRETFTAAVGGFEYTLYQLGDSAADLGLLAEYQYDGRGAEEPVTIADNDVFVGARLALNDTQDTSVLAGLTYDVDTGETIINIEAERRFGDDYLVELRARGFSGADPDNVTWALGSDNYLQLQVSRYF